MHVLLVLRGYLSWHIPGHATEIPLEVPAGTTIREAAVLAGLPSDQVAMAVVNDEQISLESTVDDGQRIVLLPPIDGG